MTTGCIWGYWDRWHEGMTASMTEAMRVCDGDDLHVVVIEGSTEINEKVEVKRSYLVHRRNYVKDKVKDIAKDTGYKPKIIYHIYETLTEAITDCGSYPFDILFVVEHDKNNCVPFNANIAAAQFSKTSSGRKEAKLHVVKSVFEEGTEITCSSTRLRKREKLRNRAKNK